MGDPYRFNERVSILCHCESIHMHVHIYDDNDDHNDIDKDDNDDILGITAKNTYIYM